MRRDRARCSRSTTAWPPRQQHLDPPIRPQRHCRERPDDAAWYESDLVSLRDRGQQQDGLHLRKAVADADPGPAAKGEIGIAVDPPCQAVRPALGAERL